MLRNRIIPCLLLKENSLVKTVKFKNPNYIGDPINTVRIFNELEVDELCFLDISATNQKREPDYKILIEICNECFMPLSYGGGINTFDTAKKILYLGFEKVVVNSLAYDNSKVITEISKHFGTQSIIGSMDVKRDFFGKQKVYTHGGINNTKFAPLEWALKLEDLGVGEILLTSMDNEGTWKGLDLELIEKISTKVHIPVIAHGGAGNIKDIKDAFQIGKASAVALGSMVVFQQKGMGVLVNFPDKLILAEK